MNAKKLRFAVPMALLYASSLVSAVVMIAVYVSSYLENSAHPGIQDLPTGLFMEFTYTMVVAYLVATGATLLAFVVHYRSDPPLDLSRLDNIRNQYFWISIILLIFDYIFFDALDRGTLSNSVTPYIMENRDLFDAGRRVAFFVSTLIIALFYLRVKILRRRSPDDSN